MGGTGRDNIYGGWGDDLLNADDNQDTTGGSNDAPDTHPSYEDRAYGGAGRDVLIGNTGGDRLIDWTGEFNSYIVPFAPFGLGTVSRTLQPQLAEFLYALSASDGVDLTRAADTGADPARNGEPLGELGVVRQQDFAWQQQTGGPRDPQAGNLAGGKRDVLRSASFDDPAVPLSGFAADSGTWTVTGGALQVSATSTLGDAVSVFQIGDALPMYFEMQASVTVLKPTAGWKANSFLIFDYIDKVDFKFAGIDASTNKLVIGHRNASGWVVDSQTPFLAKAGTSYNMLMTINGLTATLMVDNKTALTKTYSARVIDGYSYGLNWGLTGVGSDSARGTFDNIQVQVIAPEATTIKTDQLTSATGAIFSGQTNQGSWIAAGGRYAGAPVSGSDTAVQMMTLGVSALEARSLLELSAKLSVSAQGGFVFDRYGTNDYKFVMLDQVADKVLIGHRTERGGVVIDASVSRAIAIGVDYTLGVVLKGSTVSATLNGQVVLSYAFNAVTVDGSFGLISRGGTTSFDVVTLKTNDARVAALPAALMAAESPSSSAAVLSVSSADLAPLVQEAIRRWVLSEGEGFADALRSVDVEITDLPGMALGSYVDGRVLVDVDAAGLGWFIDRTPGDDSEYALVGDTLVARQGLAAGHIDLLSVIGHELGHAAGLQHADDASLMASTLASGIRTATSVGTSANPGASASSSTVTAPSGNSATASAADGWGLPAAAPAGQFMPAVAPIIDWSGSYAAVVANKAPPASSKSSAWQGDFVNHLARNEAQRNPNASLKVQINVAPKVSPNLSSLQSSP